MRRCCLVGMLALVGACSADVGLERSGPTIDCANPGPRVSPPTATLHPGDTLRAVVHEDVRSLASYSRHGFTLDAANRDAYPDLPDEIQLLWRRNLDALSCE